MRVPYSWLREFVPAEAEPDALAERLSLTGLKVEEILRFGRDISGVVVGEVRAMREHPNADSLTLVRAFDGATERDIVCGARNYVVGDRVPLALPGAHLPGGVEIGARVVRGEKSEGMLCSARELHIAEDHSGILILDPDAPLGGDIVRALDIEDAIFDIDVTPNRPDALCVAGVAREVAALYGLPFTLPEVNPVEGDRDVQDLATVRIEDARGCARYLARVIEGLRIGPSPWWMRRRILACDMRPISNVVDITNYVLLERGHPLHAFDLDRLRGSTIVVRKPRRGERLTTLDGQERALVKDDVAICDAEGPVALAGIMGGATSEVSAGTTRILLESAYFDQMRIAATARRLAMRTEASVRFERGADIESIPAAAARAAALFAEIAGGVVARGAIDALPRPRKPRAIRLRVARAKALIGAEQTASDMAGFLRAIGCTVEASKATLRVMPPSFRPDIQIEEDLIEEVARLYGYDKVPETLPARPRIGTLSPMQRRRRLARSLLLGAGVSEAQTLSLLPSEIASRLGLPDDHAITKPFRVSNPISEEEALLRPSLVPGLLVAAQRNVARRVLPVRLFEIGTVFLREDAGPREAERVAFVLCGPAGEGWHGAGRTLDFFDGKGVLEVLLAGLGIADWSVRADESAVPEGGHPGRSGAVEVAAVRAGYIGELHPRMAAMMELPERVVVAELDLRALLDAARAARAVSLPRFPAVHRDIAIVVPDRMPSRLVADCIRDAGGPLVEDVVVFDVYRGEPVPQGWVSLAFAVSLRDPTRTLTDQDADAALQSVRAAVRRAGWGIRE